MCGIAGFIGQGNEKILKEMAQTLAYRGPDEEGHFFDPKNGVGFGHQRLSIIDLKTGSQPIFNEDKSIVIIFNGEIYNFGELKKQLTGRHQFYTNSDTEVIVHLYEEKKEKFVEELSGMFAIALWDAREKKLILARDRFGEKPLYFAQVSDTLVFGSELKALFYHPTIKKELNQQALEKYFLYESIPAPGTIFKNIYKLPAGHLLIWRNGQYQIKEYFNIFDESQKIKDRFTKLTEKEILNILDKKLDQAVKKMLMADVPLGVFLSGGIDSSTITYYAQKNSNQKINTFCIGFSDRSFDESKYSQIVASRIGNNHHLKIFDTDELIKILPEVYAKLDEPMADPSLLPTFLLSRFTRNYVKVALGGDGGDELFMGYPTFQAERLAQFYNLLPKFIRDNFIRPLVLCLPTSYKYMSFDFRLKKFVNYFNYPSTIRNQLWIGAFDPSQIKELFNRDVKGLFSDIDNYQGILDRLDNFQSLSYLYLKYYMQEQILTKVDRASMYNSLEIRAPFLDPDLATWLFGLPTQYKLRFLQTKYLLKKLMAPKIGQDIVYRKKHGFQPPIALWLKNELRDLIKNYLNKKRIEQEGIFNSDYVEQLKQEHLSGKIDRRKHLWTLLVFQIWKENWL